MATVILRAYGRMTTALGNFLYIGDAAAALNMVSLSRRHERIP
jgi:hypothetical protein